ncbi:hypothetical protein KUL72_07830 [Bradyrhizobium arachidis]|uniref:hypothetical protein n=1 Tax=Bradyrhizobium arachidis TaxID=858423 RepID=UPI00220FCC2E|nr:hypothetical protein KUL72_07830 [Bradyrhizobium arachidis]
MREAVVVAHEGPGGEQRLVAYMVCAPEAGSNGLDGSELAGALRAHISAHLPDYMVPSAFVRLGTALSVVLFGVAYFVQLEYGKSGLTRNAQRLHRLAYVSLLGPLAAFLIGLRFSYAAIASAVGG